MSEPDARRGHWLPAPGPLVTISALVGLVLGCAGSGTVTGGQPVSPGLSGRSTAVEADDGHLLVVLRSSFDRPTPQIVERLALRYRLTPRAAWPMKSIDRECVVFDVLGGRVDDALLRRIEGDPAVELAQVNATFEVRGQPGTDPHADLQYARDVLRLDAAHRRATGRGVRVAIVDTGAELDHPDLRGQVAEANNFVAGSEGFTTDRHGTAVAGVIAAARGNGVGILGVAPDAKLHVLKACWYPRRRARSGDDGEEARAVCSSYTLALALDHAVDARYEVVNLSLGGPEDPLLERIVEAGIEREMVFVAPARERPDDGFLDGAEEVLRVAALSGDAGAQPGSASPDGSRSDVLGAPGVEVLTTVPGGGFDFVGGASIASAHVAGVVALLLEHENGSRARPQRRLDGLGELLRETSRPMPGGGPNAVDACAALVAAAVERGWNGRPTPECEDGRGPGALRPTSEPSPRP
ncbi:MAG TPA: S8 family serine peptidase [Thermoanaerobaculia bacterium]|nr:S8 family serine peptidase [Thermoanaerobaculia bacterium]